MLRLSINISQELLRTSKNVQKLTKCNFSRLACNTTNVSLKNNVLFTVYKHSRVPTVYVVRHQSTVDSMAKTVTNTQEVISSTVVPEQQIQNTIGNANTAEVDKSFISEIPDAPIPPSEDVTNVVGEVLTATGEPTFTSLGLGGYGPIGIMQYCLEWLHITCDLPWWGAIAALTIMIKVVTIVPTINISKNAVKMSNIMPQMMEIQNKMSEARRNGSQDEVALYAYQLQTLLRKNGVSSLAITNTLIRFAFNIPAFFALREMTTLPVESLKTGGLWWFTDLTASDPYYLLPTISTVGLYLVTESSLRTAAIAPNATISPAIRYVLRGLPAIGFVFAINFPGAVLCYWFLANSITLTQNEILKMEKVKRFLNFPPSVKHEIKTNSTSKKKGFKESFSESWTNIKISNKIARRLRADEMQFNAAGKGPVKKTFKYNPVTNQPAKSIAAMKK